MSYRSMLTTGKQRPTYVSVKEEVQTEDDQGGYVTTWKTIHRRKQARFNAMSEKDLAFIADKLESPAEFKVYMEYASGLKENNRLVKQGDGREFEVVLIMDWDEDKRFMRLAVHEVDRLE